MKFLKYLSDKRKLEASIRATERAYAPSLRGNDYEGALAAMMGETEYDRVILEDVETGHTEDLAAKWGIAIDPSLYSDLYVSMHGPRHAVLDQNARAKVHLLIRGARRESIKWWVQVVVLPLAGLIGTVIGVLSFLHK